MIDIVVGMSYQSPQCFELYNLVFYAAQLLLLCLLYQACMSIQLKEWQISYSQELPRQRKNLGKPDQQRLQQSCIRYFWITYTIFLLHPPISPYDLIFPHLNYNFLKQFCSYTLHLCLYFAKKAIEYQEINYIDSCHETFKIMGSFDLCKSTI